MKTVSQVLKVPCHPFSLGFLLMKTVSQVLKVQSLVNFDIFFKNWLFLFRVTIKAVFESYENPFGNRLTLYF